MPPTGAFTTASRGVFLQRRDLRVDGGDARARGVDLLRPGAGPQPRERVGRGLRALLRGAHPRRRHVPPRPRVVALLHRSGVGAQQPLEALEIGGGGVELRLRAAHVGLRRLHLRRGLADVFGARAGAQQRELRLGLLALRRRAAQREVGVRRVDPRDDGRRR